MKIAVLAKIIKGEINPFDACALEEALKIPEAQITVICMGNESCLDELRRLSRLEVENVVLLCDKALAGSDTLCTSYALSKVLSHYGFERVFCGRQTIDGDTAQTPAMISVKSGYNLITNVQKIESVSENSIECTTPFGREKTEVPYIITVERINTLRFPRLRSKVKEPVVLSLSDIGADKTKCGLDNSPTKVLKSFESPSGKRKCTFITFDKLDEVIKEALSKEYTPEEAEEDHSQTKLPEITVVGKELVPVAEKLSDNIKVLDIDEPYKLANKIKDDNVVLWKADLWGRKNAPVAAALLETGLCADCIKLETDGEKLFMYRPAFGGSLTAKIECRTKPQMATVRLHEKDGNDLIVSVGRGAQKSMDKAKELCEKYGGELCGSRAAVDLGLLPYSCQVGLTGKRVSPKVYIAIGISGAVQHTCAIEDSKIIIGINSDKNAEIFDFCDYGIVTEF